MAVSGSNRVLRGGSWNNDPQNLRSAQRNNNLPGNRNNDIGFRSMSTKYRPKSGVQGLRFCASGFVQAIARRQRGTVGRTTTEPPRLVVLSGVKIAAALFYSVISWVSRPTTWTAPGAPAARHQRNRATRGSLRRLRPSRPGAKDRRGSCLIPCGTTSRHDPADPVPGSAGRKRAPWSSRLPR